MEAPPWVEPERKGDTRMSVWLTIPSARPPEEAEKCLKLWRERGYKIALWVDEANFGVRKMDRVLRDPAGIYPGYASAVNSLIKDVMYMDPTAEWFVIGGDDVQPDPNKSAEEIAEECVEHFAELLIKNGTPVPGGIVLREDASVTFGVMQPTGDRWGENPNHPREDTRSAYIDRVAGSAWLGREFCRRVNGGRGPLWSGNPQAERKIDRKGYTHMFVDEELRHVAVKLGIYWERPDLTHHHAHAGRVPNYNVDMIPPHLRKWTVGEEGKKHWKESEELFFARRADSFPGHECL